MKKSTKDLIHTLEIKTGKTCHYCKGIFLIGDEPGENHRLTFYQARKLTGLTAPVKPEKLYTRPWGDAFTIMSISKACQSGIFNKGKQ